MTATLLRREPPETPDQTSSRRLTERVFRIRESGIVVVLALFVAVTASVQHRFLSCLLYTSPSPRDPKTSRMPSSA